MDALDANWFCQKESGLRNRPHSDFEGEAGGHLRSGEEEKREGRILSGVHLRVAEVSEVPTVKYA